MYLAPSISSLVLSILAVDLALLTDKLHTVLSE